MPDYLAKTLGYFLLLGLFIITSCNQPDTEESEPERRKSPIAIAKLTHPPTETYIKIVYGQPYKRDREIFGELVPYDEVWRTGANEATELTTTSDIMFGDQKLEAGTYALFSIPREDEPWTIILNEELGQWGAFDYNKSFDVIRIEASSEEKESVTEAFTIQFAEVTGDSTAIVMEWDQTRVNIPIQFISENESAS